MVFVERKWLCSNMIGHPMHILVGGLIVLHLVYVGACCDIDSSGIMDTMHDALFPSSKEICDHIVVFDRNSKWEYSLERFVL